MSQHLNSAAERGNLAKVIEHLEQGADINFVTKSRGITALHLAVCNGHVDVVKALIDRRADPNLTEAFSTACHYGNADVIQHLLRGGADSNLANEAGVTPLMIAAKFASTDIVRRLLDAGGDPRRIARSGQSVLDFANASKFKSTASLIRDRLGRQTPVAPAGPATSVSIPWPKLIEGKDATRLNPENTLWAYIHAMNLWEKESSKRHKASLKYDTVEQVFEQISADMNAIFALYCTPKDRPYGRTSFGNLPEYDPEVETILQSTIERPGRAVIVTRHARHGSFRYVLLKKEGRWLIDNKKIDLSGKWSAWTL